MKTLKVLVPGLVLVLFSEALAAPKADDVPPLIKQLNSGNSKARAEAAKELGHIGLVKASLVKDAIEPLLTAAKDKDTTVRMAALAALGQVNPTAEQAVPVFIEALKADNEGLKRAGAQGLAYFGAAGKEALPELRKIMDDIRKLDKDEQKKKRELSKSVGAAIEAIGGKKK